MLHKLQKIFDICKLLGNKMQEKCISFFCKQISMSMFISGILSYRNDCWFQAVSECFSVLAVMATGAFVNY